ncbi:dephospho-CoA kinase [Oceanithermus desulfurans]|uniref:Dephospho-CoA kinase n=2 Tax=Oceanithermus desulfurans TaxID=227924 RepID=A0A511RI85_9DEIN|nr:dephospho-CoA kinase [Oceanithermus desulfurans]MBB6030351.1 dephospho-CoA kinase [Oceanithermus desulfurans]GEM89348.1 dephospho-CoA kinase [Oceanithermus desulfurans NBRC 100063]
MKVVALTGNIGSGKTTVARELERLGAEVIYADELARQARAALAPEICRAFPDACVGGRPDDRRLARRVFADPEARRRLEGMIHPWVRRAVLERLERLAQSANPPELVVLELPLLFETGWNPARDGVLVVAAPEALRARRVAERSGLSLDEFRARDAAQLPQEEKVRRADWVIVNDGDLDALRARVQRWYAEVVREASA